MPLKVNVGLSKKVGLPDFGASCHVEYGADASLLNTDLEGFHRQVRNAFIACRQAVQDELHRHQATDQASQGNRGVATASQNGNGPHGSNGNGSQLNGPRRTNGRKATASQVRALEAIGNRLQLNINEWLHEKYGTVH